MADIGDIAIFQSLSEESRRRHASNLTWRMYSENELVIDLDDTSSDVLFIISGAVRVIYRVEIGKDVILAELGPGACFGELAAIDGAPRSASVTTLQKSRIATMHGAAFMDVLTGEPAVCRAVLKTLAGRIRNLSRQLSEQALLTAVERLYAELLRLSSPRGRQDGVRSVSPPPTHQELAERIGSRREVVSRAMSALQEERLLERTRGAFVLPDPGELNRRISKKGLGVDLV